MKKTLLKIKDELEQNVSINRISLNRIDNLLKKLDEEEKIRDNDLSEMEKEFGYCEDCEQLKDKWNFGL